MDEAKDRLSRLLDALARSRLLEGALEAEERHRAALAFEPVDRLPIIFSWPLCEDAPFPPLPNGSIYQDPAAMLYNELVAAWGFDLASRYASERGGELRDDLCPTIRPNWGTVIVASVLGGAAEQTGDNVPWIRKRDDRPIGVEAVAEADPDPARAGWMPRVIETYEAYRELLAPWPELGAALRITLPDLQGPLDSVEQLAGAELFVDMLERPEAAARALLRAAEVQVACARLLAPLVDEGPEGRCHAHGFQVPGNILIRDDSAVMISPELYREVVAPADEAVLSALGGGGIHACGRIEHAVPAMLELPGLRCLDFGQSSMNDVDWLHLMARPRGIPFLRVQPSDEELADGSILDRFPTGASLFKTVASAGEARALFGRYLEAASGKEGRAAKRRSATGKDRAR